jgi:hypothetical protein
MALFWESVFGTNWRAGNISKTKKILHHAGVSAFMQVKTFDTFYLEVETFILFR